MSQIERERLRQGPQQYEMKLRHAAYYIERVAQADQEYAAGRQQAALAQFDREKGQLDVVRAWLWKQPTDLVTNGLIVAEARATVYIGIIRDAMQSVRVPQQKLAIAAAKRQDDMQSLGLFLGQLGNAYYFLGDVHKSLDYHEQHLVIAHQLGDQLGEGRALCNLGVSSLDLGRPIEAVNYHEKALYLARKLKNRRDEGMVLGNLGNVYLDMGNAYKAIFYLEQDLKIACEIGDRRGEAITLGNLGIAYHLLGEAQTAICYHEQDLIIAREIGDRRGEGMALGNLGAAYYLLLGEMKIAIGYFDQHLVITREIGNRYGESYALGNLGSAYKEIGDIHAAFGYLEQALAISREVGDRRGEGATLAVLGAAHHLWGNFAEALTYCEVAYTMAQEVRDRALEGTILRYQANIQASLKQQEQALANYMGSLAILRDIGNRSELACTRWAYGQFLIRQGERERGIALMAECVAYEQQIGHAKAGEHAALVEQLRAGGELPPPPYAAGSTKTI